MSWNAVLREVEAVTGETVLDHRELDSVASSVREVTLSETGRVVVKVPRIEDGRLSTPPVLDLVRARTDVPVPELLAVRDETAPSFVVMEYVEGRVVSDLDELPADEVRRFAREVGGVLGTLHGADLPLDAFGRIRCDDSRGLHTLESFESWRPRFRDTMTVNLDALEELRLGDLADPVRDHLERAVTDVPDVATPALNYHDCKVSNFVLAEDGGDGLVRAVLDWEALETTHWAYNLAFAEDVVAGGQSVLSHREVMDELLAGYRDARGWESASLDEEWFDTYRLAVRVLRAASPYWLEDRDDWSGAEADRLRASIRELL